MAKNPMVSAIAAIAERMLADIGDHAAARQMQAQVTRLSQGATALDNVNANRSPLDTPAAHEIKVARLARTYDKEATATLNRALQIYAEGQADLARRIDAKVKLKSDAFAEEIRTTFRGLDSKGRAQCINQLVEENGGPALAAILEGPSLLTGIPDEQKARYEQAILARHASAELNEREQLAGVFEAVGAATRAAGGLVKEFTDPNKLAEIERGAEAANAAGAAFDQSMQ